ncbi:helix-turn-helix domain-containing protein [Paraburkholderia bryophila]|uniref:helix-turn-helix domain-containing protein n=1 Tax=Paraburkholderia bryophila TaxID=420952 RepID=UPI00142E0392|nr:helix-turn-helix domain-containing protein [Paraburkholderia bryophila]
MAGFARLTNALINAGSNGALAVYHPTTLLPYDVHNSGVTDEDDPITADWVASISDVLRWFNENGIEAARWMLEATNASLQSDERGSANRETAMHQALERNGGNKTKTAAEFGITRQRLSQIIGKRERSDDRKVIALTPQDPFGVTRKRG